MTNNGKLILLVGAGWLLLDPMRRRRSGAGAPWNPSAPRPNWYDPSSTTGQPPYEGQTSGSGVDRVWGQQYGNWRYAPPPDPGIDGAQNSGISPDRVPVYDPSCAAGACEYQNQNYANVPNAANRGDENFPSYATY